MIPVKQYADDTARIRAGQSELASFDQAWRALKAEFERVAALVEQRHSADIGARAELEQLSQLNDALAALESSAVSSIDRLNALLTQIGDD